MSNAEVWVMMLLAILLGLGLGFIVGHEEASRIHCEEVVVYDSTYGTQEVLCVGSTGMPRAAFVGPVVIFDE